MKSCAGLCNQRCWTNDQRVQEWNKYLSPRRVRYAGFNGVINGHHHKLAWLSAAEGWPSCPGSQRSKFLVEVFVVCTSQARSWPSPKRRSLLRSFSPSSAHQYHTSKRAKKEIVYLHGLARWWTFSVAQYWPFDHEVNYHDLYTNSGR